MEAKTQMNAKDYERVERGESVFTGKAITLVGMTLLTVIVTTCTFSIATPWMLCWIESWKAKNTFINGKRLEFNGTGGQLIGRWMLWFLLCIVTFSVYAWWLPVQIERWRVSHIHFAGRSSDVVKPAAVAEKSGITYAVPMTPAKPGVAYAVPVTSAKPDAAYAVPTVSPRPDYPASSGKSTFGEAMPSYATPKIEDETTPPKFAMDAADSEPADTGAERPALFISPNLRQK